MKTLESDSEEFVTRMHPSFNTYIFLFLEQAVHETLMREKRSIVCGVRVQECSKSVKPPQAAHRCRAALHTQTEQSELNRQPIT